MVVHNYTFWGDQLEFWSFSLFHGQNNIQHVNQ